MNLFYLRINNILCHKNFNWGQDHKSEDNIGMTENGGDVIDMNIFTKFLRPVQDSNKFESHKTLFLYGIHLSRQPKGAI